VNTDDLINCIAQHMLVIVAYLVIVNSLELELKY
jgi:hypothetical protein